MKLALSHFFGIFISVVAHLVVVFALAGAMACSSNVGTAKTNSAQLDGSSTQFELDGAADEVPQGTLGAVEVLEFADGFKETLGTECAAAGQAFCPCSDDTQCDSHLCVPGPTGTVCSRMCQGAQTCPPGFACKAEAGQDPSYFCYFSEFLCRPCNTVSDCDPQGVFKNTICTAISPGTSEGPGVDKYCTRTCSPALSAPEGYICTSAGVLAPIDGACKCPVSGVKVPCQRTVDGIGTCAGVRECLAAGASSTACSAPTPSIEVCDDGQDNDCNGKTDGFAEICSDGNACTVGDTCLQAVCVPGKAPVCDDGNTCTVDTCDKATGCVSVIALDGAACSDGSQCTIGEICIDGICKLGKVTDCNDDNSCTIDSCAPTGGCKHSPTGAGAVCDDDDACTVNTVCKGLVCAGAALVCEDGNDCTSDSCDKEKGCTSSSLPKDTSCDDGNSCTTADKCSAGTCVGKPTACNQDTACIHSQCAPESGACAAQVLAQKACDDGKACTAPDFCNDIGTCVGVPLNCSTKNACVEGSCSEALGKCVTKNLDNVACDDKNLCTMGDHCTAGSCGGKPIVCDDLNPCTADGCTEGSCHFTPMPDNTPCSDGDACTISDSCKTGTCAGLPTVCDDGEACTEDTCNQALGKCVFIPIAGCLP